MAYNPKNAQRYTLQQKLQNAYDEAARRVRQVKERVEEIKEDRRRAEESRRRKQPPGKVTPSPGGGSVMIEPESPKLTKLEMIDPAKFEKSYPKIIKEAEQEIVTESKGAVRREAIKGAAQQIQEFSKEVKKAYEPVEKKIAQYEKEQAEGKFGKNKTFRLTTGEGKTKRVTFTELKAHVAAEKRQAEQEFYEGLESQISKYEQEESARVATKTIAAPEFKKYAFQKVFSPLTGEVKPQYAKEEIRHLLPTIRALPKPTFIQAREQAAAELAWQASEVLQVAATKPFEIVTGGKTKYDFVSPKPFGTKEEQRRWRVKQDVQRFIIGELEATKQALTLGLVKSELSPMHAGEVVAFAGTQLVATEFVLLPTISRVFTFAAQKFPKMQKAIGKVKLLEPETEDFTELMPKFEEKAYDIKVFKGTGVRVGGEETIAGVGYAFPSKSFEGVTVEREFKFFRVKERMSGVQFIETGIEKVKGGREIIIGKPKIWQLPSAYEMKIFGATGKVPTAIPMIEIKAAQTYGGVEIVPKIIKRVKLEKVPKIGALPSPQQMKIFQETGFLYTSSDDVMRTGRAVIKKFMTTETVATDPYWILKGAHIARPEKGVEFFIEKRVPVDASIGKAGVLLEFVSPAQRGAFPAGKFATLPGGALSELSDDVLKETLKRLKSVKADHMIYDVAAESVGAQAVPIIKYAQREKWEALEPFVGSDFKLATVRLSKLAGFEEVKRTREFYRLRRLPILNIGELEKVRLGQGSKIKVEPAPQLVKPKQAVLQAPMLKSKLAIMKATKTKLARDTTTKTKLAQAQLFKTKLAQAIIQTPLVKTRLATATPVKTKISVPYKMPKPIPFPKMPGLGDTTAPKLKLARMRAKKPKKMKKVKKGFLVIPTSDVVARKMRETSIFRQLRAQPIRIPKQSKALRSAFKKAVRRGGAMTSFDPSKVKLKTRPKRKNRGRSKKSVRKWLM